MYTKRELMNYFGNPLQLSKFMRENGLKITHQAVYAWPMDEPVPELRYFQLKALERKWKRNGRANGKPGRRDSRTRDR